MRVYDTSGDSALLSDWGVAQSGALTTTLLSTLTEVSETTFTVTVGFEVEGFTGSSSENALINLKVTHPCEITELIPSIVETPLNLHSIIGNGDLSYQISEYTDTCSISSNVFCLLSLCGPRSHIFQEIDDLLLSDVDFISMQEVEEAPQNMIKITYATDNVQDKGSHEIEL